MDGTDVKHSGVERPSATLAAIETLVTKIASFLTWPRCLRKVFVAGCCIIHMFNKTWFFLHLLVSLIQWRCNIGAKDLHHCRTLPRHSSKAWPQKPWKRTTIWKWGLFGVGRKLMPNKRWACSCLNLANDSRSLLGSLLELAIGYLDMNTGRTLCVCPTIKNILK